MSEIKIRGHYRNLHTGEVCKVTSKIFYNIAFEVVDDKYHLGTQYCHYKRFRKNWEEVVE